MVDEANIAPLVSGMIIAREASSEDAPEISEVYRSDYPNPALFDRIPDEPEYYYPLGGQWMHESTCREHIERFKNMGGIILVAELNGRIVGEIELMLEDDPPPYGRYLYIYTLMVHRQYRGRGIGSRLVREAERYARGLGVDNIMVVAEDRSRGFYEKLGFELFDVWATVRIEPERSDIEASFDRVDGLYLAERLLREKYRPVLGKFGGNRSLLYDLTCSFSSLRKLRIEHIFLRTYVDERETILALRRSSNIPNIVCCWCDERISVHTAISIAKNAAYMLGIGQPITCVQKKHHRDVGLTLIGDNPWYARRP